MFYVDLTCTSIGSRGSIVRFGLSALLLADPPHPLLVLPPLLLLLAAGHLALAGSVLLIPSSEAQVETAKSNFTGTFGLIVPRTAHSTRIAAKKRYRSEFLRQFLSSKISFSYHTQIY